MTHDEYADLRGDIAEVKADIKDLRNRIDSILAGGTPTVSRQINEHGEQIKDHEKRLRTLEEYAPFIKAMMVIATALGASVVALIWALIIGQAQVIFP